VWQSLCLTGETMADPKITVLMSVYNGEKHLQESISSILDQTFKDFEFIIINDGSTDRSREIIISCRDSRIRLVNNEKNIGLTRSLNKGLKLATGIYIARMDADDVSMPARFEKQVVFLDSHPSVGVVGINSLVIDEQGKPLFKINHPTVHGKIISKLLLDNKFVHSSVMLRKTCLKTSGYYNEDFQMAQDYELFLRLSLIARLANISESLHKWRMNQSAGISVTKRPEQLKDRDKIRKIFLERHYTLNKNYVKWILANFQNNPEDIILSEYLHRISRDGPIIYKLFILKAINLYYLKITVYFIGEVLGKIFTFLSGILSKYSK
jgi:glycosyltransferase involved in cell wall biosynthesis